MNYRIARLTDLKEIIVMKNEVKERILKESLPIWLDEYPSDFLIKEDIEKGSGRVLMDGRRIIAYASFYHANEEYPANTFKKENLQSFGRIMVCNEYLGKHCGTYMVSEIIKEAKLLPVEGVGILVDACNHRAVHLYETFGFKKEGSKQFPYAYLDMYGLYFK